MRLAPRRLLALGLLPLSLAASSCAKPAEAGPLMTVYKTPTCGCCKAWVEHMQQHGFRVEVVDRMDLTPVKRQHGVPAALESCHTGVVDGYVVEGHVPAQVVRKLLAERPAVKGIGVPGMPAGSPGMEMGGQTEPYEVYTFDQTGPRDIYSAH